MDTKTKIACGLYILAQPLDVGEIFTLDRGAESLTFDTTTRDHALTRRVRGLAEQAMLFAAHVLPDGSRVQHEAIAELAKWLECDMRIFITREPEGLGLVLARVGSGIRAETTVSRGTGGFPAQLGSVLDTLRNELKVQE
jgi:hypothetical protein